MNRKMLMVSLLAVFLLSLAPVYGQQPAGAGDKEITQNVYAALFKDFQVGYNNQLEVRTFDGVVILTGLVEDFGDIKRIVEIARGVPGVKSVDSRINVKSAF